MRCKVCGEEQPSRLLSTGGVCIAWVECDLRVSLARVTADLEELRRLLRTVRVEEIHTKRREHEPQV